MSAVRYPAPIVDILDAQDAGREACFANAPIDSCPYRGDDELVSFMRRMWVRGWVDGKHTLLYGEPDPVPPSD